MTRNILLTSLDTLDGDRTLRYYAAQNEFGYGYCEAVQSMEASTKYVLARFPIDSILVIGEEASSDGGDGDKPIRLKDARTVNALDEESFTAFDLYKSRIAQYIGEQSLEQEACVELVPEAERAKFIDFVHDFQEKHSTQDTKRLNRFFDELAQNRQLYEQFKDAVIAAFPDAGEVSWLSMKWVNNFVYTQLKPTSKLEILPVNENVCARYVHVDMLEKRDYWVDSVLNIDQEVIDGKDEINLYVSLGNDSAVDPHLVMNMLDIVISTPGSHVQMKKVYGINEPAGTLTGLIEDRTTISRTTELVAAAHAFLNYAKTDMLVDIWEKCGEHDKRIERLIYAARHVDVGISMCNIQEVQEGIQQLRDLSADEHSWTNAGKYGLLFGVIAGCIAADYSTLLAEDGTIPFINLIEWAYRHQLYQQTLTLIEAHAPTNLVDSGIFYYCDDTAQAEEITRLFALQRLELKPYEYYKMDDLSHYFIKNYDRGSVRFNGARGEDRHLGYAALRAHSIDKPDPAKINGHTACDSIETVQNVLYAYFHLGEVRNKISHADSSAMAERRLNVSESDVSYAMIMMKESIELFITTFEKALAEVRDKKPKIVLISPDDVRNAAERMRREHGREDRHPSPRRQ